MLDLSCWRTPSGTGNCTTALHKFAKSCLLLCNLSFVSTTALKSIPWGRCGRACHRSKVYSFLITARIVCKNNWVFMMYASDCWTASRCWWLRIFRVRHRLSSLLLDFISCLEYAHKFPDSHDLRLTWRLDIPFMAANHVRQCALITDAARACLWTSRSLIPRDHKQTIQINLEL